MSNIVAIVGRPNVGKSTLYNRLTETRKAIVDDFSGVTRDRHYGVAEWTDKHFTVIDTGGYVAHSDDVFEAAIREQVVIAIEEATVILFMVDVVTGITDLDDDIAKLLRRSKKPVFVVVNKVDNNQRLTDASIFYSLGLGEIYPLSSMSGSGTGELLDEVIKHFEEEAEEENQLPKYAIVGRPNVGKSSLINALIGKERNIVTPIAGTTRDSIHIHYNQFGHEFMLIDTAGLRKKTKVKENIEFYSVMRTIKALEEADVIILMIDAVEGIESQDINIFHLAEKNKKGIVILVNKWDLIEKQTNNDPELLREHVDRARAELFFLDYAPVVILSALTGENIRRLFTMVEKVRQHATRRAGTGELNRVLRAAMERQAPPSRGSRRFKLLYATQAKESSNSQIAPPLFVLFVNDPRLLPESYQHYLCARIREEWEYPGLPILMRLRGREGVTQEMNE